jgi:uncharacterized membrane protein YbhN (UPF0104 family)
MKPKSLVKLALSATMLWLIARSVNTETLKQTFQSIPPLSVVMIIVGYTIGQLMSSFKWWTIVRSGGIPATYTQALKAYFIGMFVNCFGLGMVGGDVARGILVSQGFPKKAEGVTSVVADRIHGLTVLSIIALVTSVIVGSDRVPLELLWSLLLLTVGFVATWLAIPFVLRNIPFLKSSSVGHKLSELERVFPHNPRTLAVITGISAVFHTTQILLHVLIADAVGVTIPLATLFVVIPFVNIASSLPISWNGLGVREKSYIFFLTSAPAIVSQEQAVAFGILWLAAVTATSAIGGLVAIFTGDLKAIKAHVPTAVEA